MSEIKIIDVIVTDEMLVAFYVSMGKPENRDLHMLEETMELAS